MEGPFSIGSWEYEGAVYGLVDLARPDEIFYVGITASHPMHRARGHLTAPNSNKAMRDRVARLNTFKCRLGYVILERIPLGERLDGRERYWYDRLLAEGHALLNIAVPHALAGCGTMREPEPE